MSPSEVERRRIAALKNLEILDTDPDERFDRLVNIARRYYDAPIALFSLVDEGRQWFKSMHGLNVRETDRSLAFCDHAIRQDSLFVVTDASKDARFRDNALVVDDPHIRFYAGMPVREPDGFKLGTLCIIDREPREVADHDLDILRSLASLMEDEVERFYYTSKYKNLIPVSRINRAIRRAQNVFHTHEKPSTAFELLLSDFLVLTDSRFGFIGEQHTNSNGLPYLDVGAISNIAWDEQSSKRLKEKTERGLLFERLDTLIGASMQSKEVTLSNDPANDERHTPLPAGHPEIKSYIGLPIFSGGNRVGLVGLANRPTGYTKDIADELEPLLQTLGQLIERKCLQKNIERKQLGLERAANYDSLTGLPNRRKLGELFDKEVALANQRRGSLSICFIDLDGFKQLNDDHSHSIGDALLKAVASRLQHVLRDQDIVARLGGDEFIAIMRDVGNEDVYQRMLEAIRRPVNYQSETFNLSASMGITVYPADPSVPDLLLRHADQAMYAAKEAGRNQYRIFDLDKHLYQIEQWKMTEQLTTALEEHQIELYLQPKISLDSQKVGGFEALIRWNHPRRGLLGPMQFLPQLEDTEYAALVGRFVISDAVAKLKSWDNQGLSYSLNINLSPSHLLSDTFVEELESELQGVDWSIRTRLVLEILETTALSDAERIIAIVLQCRELGVEVSLDDFGTGYSSLDHFRRLPAQEIKIDRSFVRDILTDPDDRTIIKSILDLANNFKRRVIAEGVESEAVQAELMELGCKYAQGYYYTRPLPAAEALEWAENYLPETILPGLSESD